MPINITDLFQPSDTNFSILKILQDDDQDTKIQVEEGGDDDTIRMDCGGTGDVFVQTASGISLKGTATLERALQVTVIDYTTDVSTGDGKFYFHVDSRFAGLNLVDVHAEVITAGTTGNTEIQIANVTQAADILSVKMRIETGETATDTSAQPGTINGNEDDMTLNDLIRIDIDSIQSTAPKGLIITMGFQLP